MATSDKMAGTYVERYIDTVNGLPAQLYRSMTDFRTASGNAQACYNLLEKLGAMDPSETSEDDIYMMSLNLRERLNEILMLAEEKVFLAQGIEDQIDRNIKRLDLDLKKYEQQVIDERTGEAQKKESAKSGKKKDLEKKKAASKAKAERAAMEAAVSAKEKKKNKAKAKKENEKKAKANSKASAKASKSKSNKKETNSKSTPKKKAKSAAKDKKSRAPPKSNENGDDDPDKFCICGGPSYGEMIGCDNDDCEIEWFHFGCVGLKTKPKGDWYCPACRKKRAKEGKK
eukprot:Clim_evm8s252 gene=Clim_evmTU8s252